MNYGKTGQKHTPKRKPVRRAGNRPARYRRRPHAIIGLGLSLDGMTAARAEPKQPRQEVSAPSSKPRQVQYARPALPRQSKSAVLTRTAITYKPVRRSLPRRVRPQFAKIGLLSMVFLLGGGSFVGFLQWRDHTNHSHEHTVLAKNTDEAAASTTLSENAVPREVINGYTVDADLPRVVAIPKLQINARIKRMVAQASGELSAPRNIYDAGWYDGSVKPGEKGTALLIGHVFGASKPGIFNRLNNLVPNDVIEVEMGDGTKSSFKVVSIEFMDQEKVDVEKALASSDPARPALNLLTYSGRYDVRTNSYEKRILIHAISQ